MLTHAGLAIITFILTNIDDLLILSVYFASSLYKPRNIVAGQYAGIAFLILVSLTGLVLGKIVPDKWIHLLGLFPVYLGMKVLLSRANNNDEQDEEAGISQRSRFQFVSVALVTVANGGDNIGIYTPLFATTQPSNIIIYIALFLVLTGVWCALSYLLTYHQAVKAVFATYGRKLLPYFLILLGLFILKGFFFQ